MLYDLSKTQAPDSIAKLSHDISIYFYRIKNFDNAIKYAQTEVKIGLSGLDSISYKRALFNLGLFYLRNNNLYKSITTHQKVIDSFGIDKKTYQSYCEIGRVYRRLGDFYQAVTYFEKCISEPKYFNNKDLIVNYSNLLDVYDMYNTYMDGFLKKKLILLEKVDSINNTADNSKINLINNYINYGNYYSNKEVLDVKKAKSYFENALYAAKQIKDTSKIVLINNNLSYLYNLIKSDSSLNLIRKGIKLSNANDPTLIKLYTNLSKYYYNKNDLENALKSNHKELSLLLPMAIDTNYKYIPNIKEIDLSRDKTHTFFTLRDKAHYFLGKYEEDKNLNHVKLAKKVLTLSDQFLDSVKKESITAKSKLFWQQEASNIYMMAVKTCYLLNDIDSAFYFMEKKKAVLLLENITERDFRKSINLPDSILDKEFSLKKNISEIENKIYYSNNEAEIDSLKTLHNNLKIEHTDFLKFLRDNYKKYYDYKVPDKIVSLSLIQKALDEETFVIEYVLNDNDGYILTISKENVEISKLKSVKDLTNKVNHFNKIISKPFATPQDEYGFIISANELYKRLLPTTISKANKIVIIPDYNLQFLAFEALKETKNKDDYLVKSHEISYAYSLTFLNQNKSTNSQAKTDVIAFAPIDFKNTLPSLTNSKKEIENLKYNFDGKYFSDTNASKQLFLRNINSAKILHLATHANSNDSISPWIAFRSERLFLNELYNTQNEAQLVTLSACNTADGKIKEGEGVFSLARGFFFSGSKSVASTLWTVNDKAINDIIRDFYKNLKKGQSKSEALRNSKLNYLKNHSLSESSPYYWASFILIGDTSPVELSNEYTLFYYIAIAVLILISTIFYLIKIKKYWVTKL